MGLDDIAKRHGTDKSSDSHGYSRLYERYFASFPKQGGAILELGWGGHEDPDAGGASARMWRDWLPRWTVVCIDNETKNVTDEGIQFRQGSQADPKFIASLVKEFGPFDAIVDDASHVSSLTIESFRLLWPALKPGGWYVVEDTHSGYHDFWYGKAEANPDPDGKTTTGNRTTMQFLRRLADEVNFADRDSEWDLFPKEFWLGYNVEEIHFHYNICFARRRS